MGGGETMRLKKEMLAAIAAMGAFLLWIGGSSFAQTPEADLPTTSEAEAAAISAGWGERSLLLSRASAHHSLPACVADPRAAPD